jgi:hypothetical protein
VDSLPNGYRPPLPFLLAYFDSEDVETSLQYHDQLRYTSVLCAREQGTAWEEARPCHVLSSFLFQQEIFSEQRHSLPGPCKEQ